MTFCSEIVSTDTWEEENEGGWAGEHMGPGDTLHVSRHGEGQGAATRANVKTFQNSLWEPGFLYHGHQAAEALAWGMRMI